MKDVNEFGRICDELSGLGTTLPSSVTEETRKKPQDGNAGLWVRKSTGISSDIIKKFWEETVLILSLRYSTS
jgi:hypothetical protein